MKRIRSDMNELARRMAAWRNGGGGRGRPIPDEIWAEAIRVSSTAGLWGTSKALRLNHQDLKRRAAAAEHEGAESSTASRRFNVSDGRIGAIGKKGNCRARREQVQIAEGDALNDPSPNAPSVVSFGLAQITGMGRAVVEIVGRHGERMRVEVPGNIDLAGVVQAFGSRP